MEQSPASLLLGPKPPPRDLVRELQTQQRRRLLRRAGILVGLALILFLAGLALKMLADRRTVTRSLETARAEFALGTPADLDEAAEGLQSELERRPEDPEMLAALALTRAHEWAEFGIREEEARAAVEAVADSELHDAVLARGLLALGDGDLEAAADAVTTARDLEDERSVAAGHEVWLVGMLELAKVLPDAEGLEAAITEVRDYIGSADAAVCYRRLLVGLLMRHGEGDAALEELDAARKQSQLHNGLAADEALYNAMLRQRLGGVASVSEQLLLNAETLTPLARDRARLARALVRVQSGDMEAGLEGLTQAWEELPAWDRISREFVLEVTMEAGAGEQALKWLEGYDLPKAEIEIYAAWADLLGGDVMQALGDLAALPQEHPRVAYIQGLALVEQRRYAEAIPWLERADRLIPGRVEIEVAKARAEVFTADPEAALRKLEGLAEEESWAPRAWTGLGEAQARLGELEEEKTPGSGTKQLRKAMASFERAIERERLPAEATARLAELEVQLGMSAESEQKALKLFRKAVEINPGLPRYEEMLVRHLAWMGFADEALERGRKLAEREGLTGETYLLMAQLEIARADERGEKVPEVVTEHLEQAATLGIPANTITITKARITLQDGSRKDAEQVFAEMGALLDANEADADARLVYIEALLRMRELEQALTAVRRGLGAVTSEVDKGRLMLEWAEIESDKKKYGPAAAHAKGAYTRLRDNGGPPTLMIESASLATRTYVKLKKKRPVMSISKSLVERLPYHVEAHINRARAHLGAKDTAEARAAIEKAIEVEPDSPAAHEWHGHILLRFGLRDEARAAYQKAVDLVAGTPEEADYRKNLERL